MQLGYLCDDPVPAVRVDGYLPVPAAMDGRDGGAFNERILEGLRPNFFELLSQEAMHGALRPAFQYFIKVLCCANN